MKLKHFYNFLFLLYLKIKNPLLIKRLKSKKFKVLIFSHELSNTGAPMTLINVARAIQNNGGYPVIFSLSGGPLKQKFKKMGIPVIIDKKLIALKNLFKYFDIAFINTVASWKAVKTLKDQIPYIWWCHEALLFDMYLKSDISILSAVKNVKEIYTVSNYAKSFIEKYNPNVKVFPYGIEDISNKYKQDRLDNDKIVFTMVGTIHPVKGQGIFVEAILNLTESCRNKAVFNFVGKPVDNKYCRQLLKKTKNFPEIIFTGELPHEESLKIIADSDAVVCSSRGDSFSIVIQETLMLGKLCIISNKTGIMGWINNGENGFIFDADKPEQLSKIIEKIINNPSLIQEIQKKARQTYLNNFTFEIFEKNLIKIIQEKTRNIKKS